MAIDGTSDWVIELAMRDRCGDRHAFAFSSDWEDWVSYCSDNLANAPRSAGCYAISTDREVCRAWGRDCEGVLYIGMAGASRGIRNRLKQFFHCVADEEDWMKRGHNAGIRYRRLNYTSVYPLRTLRIRWVQTETTQEAAIMEGRELSHYERSFRELPPLNHQSNLKKAYRVWRDGEQAISEE